MKPYFVTVLRLRQPLTLEQSTRIAALLERYVLGLRVRLQAETARGGPWREAELARAWWEAEVELRTPMWLICRFVPTPFDG